MMRLLVIFCKLISAVSFKFGFGSGGTWPGEIALRVYPQILKNLFSSFRKGIILVAGTNGKTTTSLLISQILVSQGEKVILNNSGANLLNGIVSAIIQFSDWRGVIKADWGVFEVDENSLPAVISNIKYQISKTQIKNQKLIIVLLNLFRDQLDRYGEVDVIAQKWEKALRLATLAQGKLSQAVFVLNADDPQIAFLGKGLKAKVVYFGVSDTKYFLKEKEHATDSIFCPNCGGRLFYKGIYYSHIGIWNCRKCGERRPDSDLREWKTSLPGLYNLYNTFAAVSAMRLLGISEAKIKNTISHFKPAFGRQEEFKYQGKKVKLFLSKNPVGFNESLKTAIGLGAKRMLIVLNDNIPDGRDVSWIWDVDFEMIPEMTQIIVSGIRTYDLAIRIKYAIRSQSSNLKSQNYNSNLKIYENLGEAIFTGLKSLQREETLYVLPTYSAMLEVRKILTGRKIL